MLIKHAPDPPNPPFVCVGGGGQIIFGGYDWLTILIPMELNIFVNFLTSNIMLFIPEEYHDPPTPNPPKPQ